MTDALVRAKCGTCHTPGEGGTLSRISWIRTTPEGWSQAIKRMGRQHGVNLTEGEARTIVKYLADSHGLAPEEAKPVMYMPERRLIEETLIPNETIRGSCASCHAFGQPLSWRRSKTDWMQLQNMHVALYAQADVQFRRRMRWDEATGPDASKTPGEIALEYLAKNAPLHSPEWAAWSSRMTSPRLTGKWLVSASAPGKGRFVGEMVVEPGPGKDEFKTTTTLRSLETGAVMRRSGTSVVYAGYSWRGRSNGGASATSAPDDLARAARETLWIAPNQAAAEGRWYWGEYDEFGFDVTLTRASGAPKVISVAPHAVKLGSKGVRFRLLGDNFPGALTPADISLGSGVTVRRIVSRGPGEVVVEADVAADAPQGQRDVRVGAAVLEKAYPVYRKADYLKVTPETSLARLGSDVHPMGYQQFEAIGFQNGADGKPNTADDIKLGPMDVSWSIEEFTTEFNDDDKDYVGTLSQTALFTPAPQGSNPDRKFGRNNYGTVWVTATARTEMDPFGKPLTGRSYLVVTVPSFQRWDQPEVSR